MMSGSGSFAVTFDTELIWGSFDSLSPAEFERQFPDIRRAIAATLRLLEQYEVLWRGRIDRMTDLIMSSKETQA